MCFADTGLQRGAGQGLVVGGATFRTLLGSSGAAYNRLVTVWRVDPHLVRRRVLPLTSWCPPTTSGQDGDQVFCD